MESTCQMKIIGLIQSGPRPALTIIQQPTEPVESDYADYKRERRVDPDT